MWKAPHFSYTGAIKEQQSDHKRYSHIAVTPFTVTLQLINFTLHQKRWQQIKQMALTQATKEPGKPVQHAETNT